MMPLPPFELHRPESLEEALGLMDSGRGAYKIIAGGTDLLPSMKQGLFTPEALVSLQHISSLREVREGPWLLRLGAMLRLSEIAADPIINQHLPALAFAASQVGTPLIQSMGTLGGNLLLDTRCIFYNQSAHWRQSLGHCLKKDGDICHVAKSSKTCLAAFSSDLTAPLMLMDADVSLQAFMGGRVCALGGLYRKGDGAKWLGIRPGEILSVIRIPKTSFGAEIVYKKLRLRRAIDYALGGIGIRVNRGKNGVVLGARAVLTSLGTHPIEVQDFAAPLLGKPLAEGDLKAAGELAAQASQPLGTHMVEAGYRRRLVRVHVGRMLEAIGGEPVPNMAGGRSL